MTVDNITSLSPKITYKFIAKLYIDPYTQLNGIILFQCLLFILVILGKPYQIATNICAYKTLLQLRIWIDDFPSFVATKTAYRLKPFAKEDILWTISLNLLKHHSPATKTYMSLNPSSPDSPDGLGINIHANCFLDKASCSIEANVSVKQQAQAMNTLRFRRPIRLTKENDSRQMSACGFLKTEVFIVSSYLSVTCIQIFLLIIYLKNSWI